MEGWIKLHRRFLKWEWFDKSEMVHLFIHLLLSANHSQHNWRGIVVNRGQVVTGLKSLNNATGISFQSLRTCLNRLESTGEINKQSNNQFTIVTINNYDSYQLDKDDTNKQTNKRLTNDQQTTNKRLTTNKNVKKEKELKEFKEEAATYLEKYSDEMLKEFVEYWTEENQARTKMRFQLEKTWGMGRRLSTWYRKSKQYKSESKNLYPGYVDSSFDK